MLSRRAGSDGFTIPSLGTVNHFGLRVVAAVVLVAACGVGSDSKSSVPVRDTARVSTPEQAPSSTRADSAQGAVAQTPAPPASDTAPPMLMAGRKKHDSVAFASTVAFGRRQVEKWPAPPAPLPWSVLPGHRIVAFYGNPLSKRMGVLG